MNILRQSFTYAFAALGLSAIGISYYVFLPKFYIDQLNVSAFWLGLIIIITRIADALLDPLIGRWVDRHPLARKKLIILVSLPLGLSFLGLAAPINLIDPVFWFLMLSIIFYVSWSCYSVPYQTLGLSLTNDYHQRTQMLGAREGALLLGTVLAAILPVVLKSNEATENHSYLPTIALIYAAILVIGAVLIYFNLPNNSFTGEPIVNSSQASDRRLIWQNAGFKTLLYSYALTSFGSTLSGALILFYIEHVLLSKLANEFIFLYFLGGLICIPFWFYWSKKVDKQRAWLHALWLATISFLGVLFLGAGDQYYYLSLILVSSMGLGGVMIIPASLQADVAERASKQAKLNLDAQMIGYWSLAKKLSAALAAGIAFPVLDLLGYQANQLQNSVVQSGLIICYAGVPAGCYLLTIFFASRYKND